MTTTTGGRAGREVLPIGTVYSAADIWSRQRVRSVVPRTVARCGLGIVLKHLLAESSSSLQVYF